MSDSVYPGAKDLMLTGSLNWLKDPVVALLVNTQFYTYSSAHLTLLDIAIPARVAASGTLTTRTVSGGVCDADDVGSFGSVTGAAASAIVLCTDTGTDATSKLIVYLDSGTGLPVNPDGGLINIIWSNGSNRIFAI